MRVALGAVLATVGFAYITYSLRGWFHQDDFVFIAKYADRLRMSELVSSDGFGRFVTQNVYWYFGQDVLGRNPELFYFVNFLTIGVSTLVLYKISRQVLDPSASMVAAVLYFVSPRVVHAFAWISNSQHLIAHAFSLGFLLLLLFHSESSPTKRQAFALLCLFVLAINSNSFAVALLAPVLWQFSRSWIRTSANYMFLVAGTLVMASASAIRTANSADGAYEVAISMDVLSTNIDFYFESAPLFIVWLVVSIVASFELARRHRMVESTMFVCSLSFFAPFAFLEFQRYPQYGALTLVFFLVGMWMIVSTWVTSRSETLGRTAVVVVTILASIQGLQEFGSRLADPLGVKASRLVDELKDDLRTSGSSSTNICFDHDPVLDAEGKETALDPGVWWWVGHGLAFSLFVDGSRSYELLENASDCDRTYFITPDSLLEAS